MHFSVSSACVTAVLVLPLLLSCVTTDVAARQIYSRSIAVGITGDEDPLRATTTEDSYEATVTHAATDEDFAEFDFDSDASTEAMDGRWIQKILQKRPSEKTQRSLRAQEAGGGDGDDASAFKSPGNPLSLGQVLANILYGPVWPANRTSAKCSEDMRIYNAFLQNFTLWATKSKYHLIIFLVLVRQNERVLSQCLHAYRSLIN